jgi:hypothetical protein
MIRQRLLWKVIGRRLVERLLRAGWIEPVRANGNGIFYDEHAVHRALKRLGREGYVLNGHARNGLRFEMTKAPKPPLEDLFANLSLEDL